VNDLSICRSGFIKACEGNQVQVLDIVSGSSALEDGFKAACAANSMEIVKKLIHVNFFDFSC
jgi:hypothetical protein